jgi:hypothetical protein
MLEKASTPTKNSHQSQEMPSGEEEPGVADLDELVAKGFIAKKRVSGTRISKKLSSRTVCD